MGKPNYRVVVSFDPQRSVFLARAPELEHLTGEGASRKDAIAKLEEEIDAQLANMLTHGSQPPKAVDETEHSGEVSAKVSKSLHRDLAYLARSEGVELDQIVSELLSAALAMRQQGRRSLKGGAAAVQSDDIGNRVEAPRGSGADGNRADGNRRPFNGRAANNPLMDDRAHFIEYVRGLENGNTGGGHRPSGGGGGQHHHNGGGGGGGGGNNNRRRRGGGRGPGPGQHGQQGPRHEGQRHDRHERHQGARPAGAPSGAPPGALPAAAAPVASAPPSDSSDGME